MSKSNPLSRNKTIKILHELTGKTYKECRAVLKANNWSLGDALGIDVITALQGLPEAVERLQSIIIAMVEASIAALITFQNTFNEVLNNARKN